jgi:hypothetical protein
MLQFLKRLFARSKNREKIQLQQGTLEVQKNTLKLEIYSANEMIRINNWTKLNQSAKRLRGIQLQTFIETLECQILRCNCRFYICVWHYRIKTQKKFILRTVGALHMYTALWLFNLHLWSALLQFNSVFTSCE